MCTTDFLRSLVAMTVVLCFVTSHVRAWADDEKLRTTPPPTVTTTITAPPAIVAVYKGGIVPFTGVLLNPAAVAQVIVDAKNAKAECDIRIEREVSKEKSFSDARLKDKDTELKYTKDTLSEQIRLRDVELDRIRNERIKESSGNVWWAVGGAVGGVVVTLAITFVVNLSGK